MNNQNSQIANNTNNNINIENQNHNQNIQQEPQLKKKNRTLQFYKFLFYSMKVEIKLHEFIDLVRFSNQSEISLWILSLVLYFNSPTNYTSVFIWIHILHLVRGLIGFFIMLKMPRSYQVVEAMKEVGEHDMENKLFNDIVRSVLKKEVVDKMQGMRIFLILYFIFTFINFIFDTIDFLYILSQIDKDVYTNNIRVILLSNLMITFLYICK